MPSTIELRQSDPVVASLDEAAPSFPLHDLLDASPDRRRALAERVREACLKTGFFYIDLADGDAWQDAVLERAAEFFDLDDRDARKQAALRADGDVGWVPMFTEPAYQPGTVAHMEAFDCDLACLEVPGREGVWPPVVGFRDQVQRSWRELSRIGDAVLRLLSIAAGFEEDFLPQACATQTLNTLRLLNYPENDYAADDRNVGIAAHTDFECITLIYQTAPGLELTSLSGHWLDAPAAGPRVVVLLGDMLERWTNGCFRATGHRVRNTRHKRMSLVMFIAANEDVLVQPLPPHVDDINGPRYRAVMQGEHIRQEVERARRNAA